MAESVRSVRPAWIGFGWFIAIALTSLLLLVMVRFGMTEPEAPAEGLGVAIALMVGFLAAGFFVGTRVNAAPMLHGLGMGIFSVIVWVALNLFVGEPTGATAWNEIPGTVAAGLLGLQTAAAMIGARSGVRFARGASSLA